MRKILSGVIATAAALFMLAAFITVILVFIECVTTWSASPLIWILLAAGFWWGGTTIMKALDKHLENVEEDE